MITLLGNVSETIMGQAPPSINCNKIGEGMPFVKAGEFGENRPIIREWTTKPLKIASKDDVLVCVVGATSGKINRGQDCAIGRSVAAVRVKRNVLDNEYLYYFLATWSKRLLEMSQGAAQTVITKSMLFNLEIPLPQLEQQKQIANILDIADAYRQKTKALIAKYDQLTQSLFLDMFGDPVTNPKGWKVVKMGDVAELKMGGTPSTKHPEYYENGEINWMKSGDIKGDFISDFPNKISALGLNNCNTKLYNANTVVIALNGQGKTRATTGIITRKTCSNQSVANIEPNDDLNPIFLHFQLKSRYKLLRNLTGDNDRSGLNLTILRNYEIHIPSMDLQIQFAERVKAIENQKLLAQQELKKADELFNSLLQKAFKGELV